MGVVKVFTAKNRNWTKKSKDQLEKAIRPPAPHENPSIFAIIYVGP